MYILKEKELECGCCLNLEVDFNGKKVEVTCQSLPQGLEEALTLLK